jgi:hypothetical protein
MESINLVWIFIYLFNYLFNYFTNNFFLLGDYSAARVIDKNNKTTISGTPFILFILFYLFYFYIFISFYFIPKWLYVSRSSWWRKVFFFYLLNLFYFIYFFYSFSFSSDMYSFGCILYQGITGILIYIYS